MLKSILAAALAILASGCANEEYRNSIECLSDRSMAGDARGSFDFCEQFGDERDR